MALSQSALLDLVEELKTTDASEARFPKLWRLS